MSERISLTRQAIKDGLTALKKSIDIKENNFDIRYWSDGSGGLHHCIDVNGSNLLSDAVDLLEADEKLIENLRDISSIAKEVVERHTAKPPVHIHEEYPEHDWERDEDGKIDEFALDYGFHNGPGCSRCYYSFCIHCDPNGWNKKPCVIDEYRCPSCNKYVCKGTRFCDICGQEMAWE